MHAMSSLAQAVRTVQITESDREWVLRLSAEWGPGEEARFLESEHGYRLLPGGGRMSTFTSPSSGQAYQLVRRVRDGRLELGCSCPGFAHHGRCKHVASVVAAYYVWALGGRHVKRREVA